MGQCCMVAGEGTCPKASHCPHRSHLPTLQDSHVPQVRATAAWMRQFVFLSIDVSYAAHV